VSVTAPPRPARRADRGRTALSGVGQLLITIGVVVLLFCSYELWVTGIYTAQDQGRLSRDLTQAWAAPPPAATGMAQAPGQAPGPAETPLGDAYARFYLPRVNGDRPTVVVEGVAVADLRKGPGHWPDSAAPGQVGNLVLSGHRTTYGAPFADLDRLQVGDALVVETRDSWATYRMTTSEVVLPSAVEVSLPVPRRPGVAPTQALITLTTCHPKLSARQRLVVHGLLQDVRPKSDGRPAALSGG
jgi:sortase A